ncbi:hypothetical protein KWF81_10260 [Acinetobacter baumannii]
MCLVYQVKTSCFFSTHHSSVAEQITRWLYPHVNDYVQDGIQTHIIDMPNYTLEDLEGIVET